MVLSELKIHLSLVKMSEKNYNEESDKQYFLEIDLHSSGRLQTFTMVTLFA